MPGLAALYEYRILARMIGDQTTEEGELKDKKDIDPESLQNPYDPDETYRYKAGEGYHGYAGNTAEAYNDEGAHIIIDYDYQQNTCSDAQFMKDYIDRKEDDTPEVMITDGAYASDENKQLAEEKGIEHRATSLTGKKPDEILRSFEFDESNEVKKCPNGHEPVNQSVYKSGI